MSISRFSFKQQWGHIGSELGRAINRKQLHDEDAYKNCLKRALNMLAEMIDDHQLKQHNLKEITRIHEFLAGVYAQSNEVLTLQEIEDYCNRFVFL